MILDNNLIAYEFYKNQFTPNPVYPSGEREESKLIDEYAKNKKDLPVLILEDDIINENGCGLKKGFYNVVPDKYLDFLLIYQKGELKAKVPVVETKFHESANAQKKQEKPKKMSDARYKKQLQKESRKYFKGENPAEVDWKEAEIIYFPEKNAYLIIYNSNNIELSGVIKL